MKMTRGTPFLVFSHIERCGGTTLNYSMLNNFSGVLTPKFAMKLDQKRDKRALIDYDPEDLRELLDAYPWIHFIGGHHTRVYQPYERVINKPVFHLTFLRNPIERYLSHFNYQRILMGVDWSLNEFLDNPRYNNWQTFRIAGEESLSKAIQYVTDKFNFVGITERYDESLVIMKELIGSDLFSIAYRKKNVMGESTDSNPKLIVQRGDLSGAQDEKAIRNNELDLRLYQYVNEKIFSSYMDRLGSAYIDKQTGVLKGEIEKYRAINKNVIMNKLLRRYLKFRLKHTSHKFIY